MILRARDGCSGGRASEHRDLRLGKTPPEVPVGKGDPQAIGAESVEVLNLAHRVLGLADRAPQGLEMLQHALPVSGRTEAMRHLVISELKLAPFEAGSGEGTPGAELDISDLGRADQLHR